MTAGQRAVATTLACGSLLTVAAAAASAQQHGTKTTPLVAYAVPIDATRPRPANAPSSIAWRFAVCNPQAAPYTAIVTAAWRDAARRPAPSVTMDGTNEIPGGTCRGGTLDVDLRGLRRWESIDINDGAPGATLQIGTLGIAGPSGERPAAAVPEDLHLQVLSPNGTTPVMLRAVNGQPVPVVIKNGESAKGLRFPVQWQIEAGPWFAVGTTELARGTQTLNVPLRRTAASSEWFWQWWPGSREGRMTVTLAQEPDTSKPLVSYVVPVRVRLTRLREPWQSTVTTLIVFGLLCIGGAAAYLVNTARPGYQRRKRLLNDIAILHASVARAGEHARGARQSFPADYEDIRHRLRADVTQLEQSVRAANPFDPDHEQLLGDAETRLAPLTQKVQIFGRLVALHAPRVTARHGVGLIAAEMVADRVASAADRLRATNADAEELQAAADELDQADTICRSAGAEHTLLRAHIQAECTALAEDVARVASDPQFKALVAAVPGARAALTAIQHGDLHAGEQYGREVSLWTVHLLHKLFRCQCAADGAETRRVAEAITQRSWTLLREADLALTNPGVAPEEVRTEVAKGTAGVLVVAGNDPVRAGQVTPFTAWFTNESYNYSGVRQQWECIWRVSSAKRSDDLDDDAGETEIGSWTLWRSFAERSEARVELVGFKVPGEPDLPLADPRASIRVSVIDAAALRPRSRKWGQSAAAAALVQVVALVALLSSGITDIESREPLAAVLLVLAAGFGANTARSVLGAGATRLASTISARPSTSAPAATAAARTASAASAPPVLPNVSPTSPLAAQLRANAEANR